MANETFQIMIKPPISKEDERWIEEQLNATPGSDEGYTDAQFFADLKRASKPLEDRAERARQQMKDGTAKKYPR